MKVILAGCSEADEHLSVILAMLGFNVYGFMDQFWKNHRVWNKILTEGGSSDDFIDMYTNVDVVSEMPTLFFWKEILDAFPSAKVCRSCFECSGNLFKLHQV